MSIQAREAVWKTLDYMEEHYEEGLTTEQLSTVVHLSRFYYRWLFYRLTEYTVGEYLHSVRLKMVAGLLKADSGKVMDIVTQCGSSGHNILTRAFRRCYGMSPTEYRVSLDIHLGHVIKPELRVQYTLVDESVPSICDDTVLGIQHRVQEEPLWFSGYIKEDESAKTAQPKGNTLVVLRGRLGQDDVLQHAALDEGNDILVPSQAPGVFTYIAIVHTAEPVKRYTAFGMPVGTYAVCEYEARSFEDLVQKALYEVNAYLFEVWLPRHGYIYDAFFTQRYIRPKQEDRRLRLWVKISNSLIL